MVHKAPANSRLRNGMRPPARPFDKLPRLFGTINSYPPNRHPNMKYRTIVGSPQVPQAGSFRHLKELLRAERARELQVNNQIESNILKCLLIE